MQFHVMVVTELYFLLSLERTDILRLFTITDQKALGFILPVPVCADFWPRVKFPIVVVF